MVSTGTFISDRYEIIDKIGTGGMADVYKARCHRLNRLVAIKILKQEYSADRKFVDKFRAEAQSAAGLSHPNIVNVYDVGEDNGLYYIVMELVEGITLKSFIERKGSLEVREATGIAIQIAMGMEAAHDNHIIHRDIKPQNIIISREGKVKVTDFGIAKAASSNTITSNAMGSVHYISPEQARGGYSDEKSDIYSLGVTLYEMLSGKVPFTGESTVSVALAHIQEDAIPLRTLNPEIPVSLDRIVQKCMQKKPERRYLTVSALIADLKQSLVNPEGDFVKLVPTLVDDSPTINISESELNTIKKNVRHTVAPEVYRQPDMEDSLSALDREETSKEEAEIDPKAEKLLVGGGIAAAVILFLLIIFMIGKFFGIFGGGGKVEETPMPSETPVVTETPGAKEEKYMPKVIGLTREQALAALADFGITPEIEEGSSELYGEDLVCDQSPAQGEALTENMIVKITVSTGSDSIYVPNVLNLSKEDAVAKLVEEGLTDGGMEEKFSDTIEEGKVCGAEPAIGTATTKGSSVKLYISKGKEVKTATVPDLFNKTEKEAMKALEEAGLKGSVSGTKESDTVEKGRVISQSHSDGTQVDENTTITFVISSGPAAVYEYYGEITISDNPFEYEDGEGNISLVLTQDGKSWEVYNEYHTYYDFPLPVPGIKGRSESVGEITMYLDGSKVGGTYSIHFEKGSAIMQGKIMKGIAGFYYVHTGGNDLYECKAKGIFRNQKVKPLVGDNVEIEILDEIKKTGNIEKILPRTNQLVRPAVSNIDQALVIFAAAKPEPNFNLLDRFLVSMAKEGIDTVICFNKTDVVTEEKVKELEEIYQNAVNHLFFASVKEENGIEKIKEVLRGKTTVLAGPSGVGKSSLMNCLKPEAQMETGSISEKIERGRHTTRHSELFFLEDQTYIMDTPGFSSLYLGDMEKEELSGYFPEFTPYEELCRFGGCAHIGEPDCGVKDALEAGKISRVRYDNYMLLYQELKDRKKY